MGRTVSDAARLLGVLAGEDAADVATAQSRGHVAADYAAFLDRDALRGARVGVVRKIVHREGADPEVTATFETAIDDLLAAGAIVVDWIPVPVLDSVRVTLCSSFKRDIEAYLATLGDDAPYRTLEGIVESGRFHPSVDGRLRNALRDSAGGEPERCRQARESRARFQEGLRAVLREHSLDALIYPTWSNPPRLVGDLTTPGGDNNQQLAPWSGFPAITVPMGWVRGGMLPTGLQFLGDAWTEGRLIALAYGYEQATHHRRPPASAPAIK
jgi:Asp-tRNA(Asn)/Glu-tRNA(Gln) amidotransferase A subunit family amidase